MRKAITALKAFLLVPVVLIFLIAALASFADREGRPVTSFCHSSKGEPDRLDAGSAFDMDTLPVDGISARVEAALERVERQLQELEEQLSRLHEQQAAVTYRKAIRDIDWKKLNNDIQLATEQSRIAMDKAHRQLTLQYKSQADAMNRQLAIAGQRVAKQSRDMAYDIEKNVRIQLQYAKDELKKNNEKLDEFRKFMNDLADDKLIDKDGKYSIEIEKGDLYINGKKQPDSIIKRYKKKYKSYFEEDSKIKFHSNNTDKTRSVRSGELI